MASELSNMAPVVGSARKKMRVGRGQGSGLGKTSGRGTKGAGARSGVSQRSYFEGGQNSLVRRLPKFGFSNALFGRRFVVVNVGQLAHVEAGFVVTEENLFNFGIISGGSCKRVKLLGGGDIGVAVVVRLASVSRSAREKILGAGGVIEADAAD